jgi:hypothetical protein
MPHFGRSLFAVTAASDAPIHLLLKRDIGGLADAPRRKILRLFPDRRTGQMILSQLPLGSFSHSAGGPFGIGCTISGG